VHEEVTAPKQHMKHTGYQDQGLLLISDQAPLLESNGWKGDLEEKKDQSILQE